jgi:hypothetical protein
MTELPILDTTLVGAIKKLMDNIRNDVDQYSSMDQIADLVIENKLVRKKAYKPLLKSVCDLIQEKGYPQTAALLLKDWQLDK